MPDLFFYEAFEEEAALLRRHLPPDVAAGFTARTIQEEGLSDPPARLISIRTQSEIPAGWAARLDGILTRSTGYDHLGAYRAKAAAALPCGYLPSYCARAVAEHAMLLWTALLRKLPLQERQFPAFHRDGLTGRECQGRTLLVVGVGCIGIEAVRIGTGLGMNVLGIDIVRRHTGVAYADVAEALPRADVVVCAMNLTPLNHRYFDYARFACGRRGAVFVNVARGEMSPLPDLLRALDDGLLGGAGLDVYEDESRLAVTLRAGHGADDPDARRLMELRSRPNVILTPHNAFNSEEAIDRKARQSVEQAVRFLRTGTFAWPVPETPAPR